MLKIDIITVRTSLEETWTFSFGEEGSNYRVLNFLLQADGEDELKKRQLMELAIINGTYRDSESMRALAAAGELRKLIL